MHHSPTIRVVLDNQPYLLVLDDDGSPRRAHGPFSPGTEPGLSLCTTENEVRDREVMKQLIDLAPQSPTLPASGDSMADA
jgi:hypothetical protein